MREGFFYFDQNFAMQVVLIDLHWKKLLPLTFSRSLSDLLIGCSTIRSKWETALNVDVAVVSRDYLQGLYGEQLSGECLVLNSGLLPTASILNGIQSLEKGQVLKNGDRFLVGKLEVSIAENLFKKVAEGESIDLDGFGSNPTEWSEDLEIIDRPSDIFAHNDTWLRKDFEPCEPTPKSQIPEGVQLIGSEIYVHPTAKIGPCILNASTGPIYIDAHAEIMEGSLIRGPFYLGEHSTVKMGAKIYGATSVGAHCKVGGEIGNSVIHSYSNKGHDGYLGNSVLGSWCNLGADTNTSNLKNNYGEVKVWDYATETQSPSGLQFHGLVMGDHSKSSINTMFNTGTVVGMCANVFDGGFPPKFVPSFTWGSPGQMTSFKMEKAFEAAEAMMSRRNLDLSETEREIFRFVSDYDKKFRG